MLKVWRFTKWFSIGIVTLTILILAALAFALFTNPGLNTILWGVNKALPQLEVGDTQGALFPRFTLNQVKFADPDLFIDLDAQSLTLAVDLNCLSDPRVCINELAIQGLNFSMPQLPPSESSAEPSEPLTSITVPLPIAVGKVSFNDIDLDILGTKVAWDTFKTSFSMTGSNLSLGDTLLTSPVVKLVPADPDLVEPEPAVSSSEESQAVILPDVLIPLFVKIAGIEIRDFKLDQAEPIVVDKLKLVGRAGEHDVHVDNLELVMPQIEASLNGNISLIQGYPLDLYLRAHLKQTELAGQHLVLKANGSVDSLSLDGEFSGVVAGVLKGDIQPLQPTLPFDAILSDAKASWPLKGDSDYQLQIDNLSASGSLDGYDVSLKAQASGTPIPDVAVTLKGSGDLKHIALSELSVDTLGGNVAGQVMANWESPVNWQGDLQLTHIQPGLQWPEAEGDISGHIVTSGALTDTGGWQVEVPTLDIVGVLREYPLNVQGQLDASDVTGKGEYQVETQGLSVAHGPNSLSAQGRLNKDWDMSLSIDFPELSSSVPDVSGLLQGRVQLSGAMLEPDISTDITAEKVRWKQEASVETLTLSGQAQPLPLTSAQADIRIQSSGIRYQEHTVDRLTVDLTGTQAEHTLTLDMVSSLLSTNISLKGMLSEKPSLVWQGELSNVHIETEQGPLDLVDPIDIKVDVDKQIADVSAHCWAQADSRVCLEKDIQAGNSGEALVTVKNFDFEQIKAYLPKETKLKGSANITAWARWAPETSPEVKLDVALPKGTVTQSLDIPLVVGWDKVNVKANLANDKLQASWIVDVTDNGDLSGQLMLPDVFAEQKQLDGELNLSTFNLDFLQPIVGEFNQVKANLDSSIRIKGNVLHPQIFGRFSVSDLLLHGDISPIQVDSGDIDIAFNGYDAKLDASIQTSDGELKLNGDGNWQDLKAWRTKLRVFADELNVNVPPMVKVKVIPDMTIEATPTLAKVTGNINLPWGRILVEQLPQSAVAVSGDQVLLNPDMTPINEERAVPFNIETDVSISIGNDFRISAFGLKGGLQGKLHVSQKDQGPFVQGEVNIVNGSYSSFGQDLLIEEGKILMTGPVDQPYVNITAVRNPDTTADDVKAGVKVTGLASEPRVEIFSDPTMPQANALSYLLRGQDIDGETGGNALTTTLIGLSLARSGKVVGELGQAFGVQDLQLDTAGSGQESQVTVSGYILPGLQVKYGVGIFNSLGEFTVRYRIIEDFYVEAVSGLYSSVTFLYQFEVD
ncbi:translocation/assembly module TamB domain-containing protein [Vibrio hangzhouensis]|uniref:Translocation and assembly module TamB n=1 Tax=Vibrio hangzhouensis TaxID=462991 RepID=A0A1H6BGJ6_9VIBR|nr:translocation/assembly module TamB domain-containing protein [Vibrio hangzhouensis]SEG59742.1 translocation and assembly module TamB [Vibrio hangzhouensis]